jgi:hypothetical protein
MFRHHCRPNWQDLVRSNVNWAPQNFHLEEHKSAKDI